MTLCRVCSCPWGWGRGWREEGGDADEGPTLPLPGVSPPSLSSLLLVFLHGYQTQKPRSRATGEGPPGAPHLPSLLRPLTSAPFQGLPSPGLSMPPPGIRAIWTCSLPRPDLQRSPDPRALRPVGWGAYFHNLITLSSCSSGAPCALESLSCVHLEEQPFDQERKINDTIKSLSLKKSTVELLGVRV